MLKYSNNNSFQTDVLDNKKVVLVDFYADWCGPCKMIGPVLEAIALENQDFDIVKVNVDENEELSYKYQIQSIPTMIIFKEGNQVDKMIGLTTQANIVAKVKQYI